MSETQPGEQKAVGSSELLAPDGDVVYGKTPKGEDLDKIMRVMLKMEKAKSKNRRETILNTLTEMSMEYIGKYGEHPVEVMKKAGLI